MKTPFIEMSIQNKKEYLKEGCGIITSKQPPKSGFIRLVIKKSVIILCYFFSHKQKSKYELTILLPGINE